MQSNRTRVVNQKIAHIHGEIPIYDIHYLFTQPSFQAVTSLPKDITGYFAVLSLKETTITVPIVDAHADRKGRAYQRGLHKAPLLTLSEWRKHYTDKDESTAPALMINANFYHLPSDYRGQKIPLRKASRTTLFGLSLHHGHLISNPKSRSHVMPLTDSLVFNEATKKITLVPPHKIYDELYRNRPETAVSAISGYTILENNLPKCLPFNTLRNNERVARTGIGILPNQHDFVVIVVENKNKCGGLTLKEFTHLFRLFGCKDALNLDGSGSSELLYEGYNTFGKPVKIQTTTSDIQKTQRPKPNFIGFRKTSQPHFFSFDDSDIPSKEPLTLKHRRFIKK